MFIQLQRQRTLSVLAHIIFSIQTETYNNLPNSTPLFYQKPLLYTTSGLPRIEVTGTIGVVWMLWNSSLTWVKNIHKKLFIFSTTHPYLNSLKEHSSDFSIEYPSSLPLCTHRRFLTVFECRLKMEIIFGTNEEWSISSSGNALEFTKLWNLKQRAFHRLLTILIFYLSCIACWSFTKSTKSDCTSTYNGSTISLLNTQWDVWSSKLRFFLYIKKNPL